MLFGLLYYAATGIYFFYDSYIPIAVFLGMHLLFTGSVDLAAAPELGRCFWRAVWPEYRARCTRCSGTMGCRPFYDKASAGARSAICRSS
jgi:hypothetical protein